jgi:hypothetical protein
VELGIDLGTSNTVAFLRRAALSMTEPVLFDGAPLLPSAVFANGDGTLLVGRDALHSARTHPERFEGNPKRRIDDGSVFLGRDVPVGDLFAALFRRVAGEAERVAGQPVVRSTISHPASWAGGRRGILQQAAERAGLGEVRLVPEPVAAAAYHARRHGLPPGQVADLMVYDLGAGTFDVAIVRHWPGMPPQVLSTTGLDDTGGQDIDAAIVGLLRGRPSTAGHPGWARLEHPTSVADQQLRRQLWDDVRAAKEMLSRTNAADLYLPLLDTDEIVTRDELEALAAPLLQRTLNTVRGAIAGAPVPLQPLTAVILVGGATRMPLVATMLHRALGIAPTVIEQPEVVVAAGCLDPMVSTAPMSPPALRPSRPSPTPGLPSFGSSAPMADGRFGLVQLVELAFPEHQGVTLRGQLWEGGSEVQYVFPSDGAGTLLLFADTNALGRYAAAHRADDPLLATPPWQVRADPSGGLNFDFELVVEHLNGPPERWLPAFLCRCRDVAAQLALYLDIEEALELLDKYTPIDEADSILRQAGDVLGRGARRQLAKIDLQFLREEWATLVDRLDAAATTIG